MSLDQKHSNGAGSLNYGYPATGQDIRGIAQGTTQSGIVPIIGPAIPTSVVTSATSQVHIPVTRLAQPSVPQSVTASGTPPTNTQNQLQELLVQLLQERGNSSKTQLPPVSSSTVKPIVRTRTNTPWPVDSNAGGFRSAAVHFADDDGQDGDYTDVQDGQSEMGDSDAGSVADVDPQFDALVSDVAAIRADLALVHAKLDVLANALKRVLGGSTNFTSQAACVPPPPVSSMSVTTR